ncbi:MAG TPA: DNA polymerase III subunit beta [Dehalococcoidia bacterium]|jgi:DNA polymerase-3 subunit beta|nr:DNA polymerase III subunit beta [Dehalococcoidia bacterium]
MKVTCTQADLARGLGIVGRAVAARSPLPITANVLIASDEGRLKLSATNLEITMSCWIDASIEEDGAITIPARLLADFVNTLPNDRISLTVAPRSRQVRLECARNEAQIGGLDAEDFPPPPVVKDGIDVHLDAKALRQAIAQTVFAAATDDSRPVLTGVDTKFEGNELTLAASDGFRLSVFKLQLDSSVEPTEIVVPAKALLELSRLLADETEPITMRTNAAKSQVLFRLSSAELVAQLIQGTFPNFNQLIPASSTSRAVAQVSEFLRETRTASVFARDGSGIVRLVVTPGEGSSPGKVVISARAEEVGDNEGEIDAAVEGEGVKIAFNGKYLQDVLQALEGGELAMETTGPSSQGVFKTVGDDNYVHVIMPMFVQW